jgi:hypothetical protein
MTARRALKLTHLLSTVWFVLCVVYTLARELDRAGFTGLQISSLFPHSALVIFLLVSLYLFALFRGVGRAQNIELEHPLTMAPHYMAFYVSAPLLGGVAGILGMWGAGTVSDFLLGVALGTLGTTIAVWVIVDPVAGLFEMLLPASRKHRAERLAQVEAQRKARQERRERLLAEAVAREEQERQRWQQRLQPQAERLAVLLSGEISGPSPDVEQEVVDIGAQAWRLGGITCMRQLREMAMVTCRQRQQDRRPVDYISYWWDGIGDWRRPSVC